MTCKVNADTTNGLKLTSDTSGEIDLQTNGTTKVHMDSSGNVGIGTTSPSQKLDVNGNINFNNNILIANDASASNIDHIWHDDAANAWNFVSDSTSKAAGNSTLKAGAGSFTGTVTATAFTGDGSALTGISAGDIVASSVSASNNSNGYVKFSNNLVIQWLRKTVTGTQTITFPLAMNHVYGAYDGSQSNNSGQLRIHSLGTTSVTVGNRDQNINGWVLITGRKT